MLKVKQHADVLDALNGELDGARRQDRGGGAELLERPEELHLGRESLRDLQYQTDSRFSIALALSPWYNRLRTHRFDDEVGVGALRKVADHRDVGAGLRDHALCHVPEVHERVEQLIGERRDLPGERQRQYSSSPTTPHSRKGTAPTSAATRWFASHTSTVAPSSDRSMAMHLRPSHQSTQHRVGPSIRAIRWTDRPDYSLAEEAGAHNRHRGARGLASDARVAVRAAADRCRPGASRTRRCVAPHPSCLPSSVMTLGKGTQPD